MPKPGGIWNSSVAWLSSRVRPFFSHYVFACLRLEMRYLSHATGDDTFASKSMKFYVNFSVPTDCVFATVVQTRRLA